MLLTREVEVGLKSQTIKWYEDKGYEIPRWINNIGESRVKRGTKIVVKVGDLTASSNVPVDVQCDGCGGKIIGMNLQNYKRSVKKDGKYFCNKCAKNGYEKWISFDEWCCVNLSKEDADEILSRWDYELNGLSPKDISRGSQGFNKKGYWLKCLDHPEHKPELKNISSFAVSRHEGIISCNQCNSISIHAPHLEKFLVNREDAEKYSMWSNKAIPLRCPLCGHEKNMKVYTLTSHGFGCSRCSDHIPYGEKFLANLLDQLNISFKTQLTKTAFKWCGNYRYDFYIGNEVNGIIETHGIQHYEEVRGWGRLSDTQENDKYKEQLAKENGIKNYIIIDCRYSQMEWIKNSIIKRNPGRPDQLCLAEVLNFKEEDVDWLQCHNSGCNNLVKTVCENWCNGIKNVLAISTNLKMTKGTVTKYLKQGTELGWCIPPYDPEEETKKNSISTSERNSVKIICVTTNEIFRSMEDAGRKYSIDRGSISSCCVYKRKSAGKLPDGTRLRWMYYDEYLEAR